MTGLFAKRHKHEIKIFYTDEIKVEISYFRRMHSITKREQLILKNRDKFMIQRSWRQFNFERLQRICTRKTKYDT